MNILQGVQEKSTTRKSLQLRPGFTVKIHQRITEGEKERVQIYEGLIIAINSGHGADKSITVRKISNGVGVEKIFPVESPVIEKIEVIKKSKVRRAKLYYMRNLSGKSARLKEEFVSSAEMEKMNQELTPVAANDDTETPTAAESAPVVEESASTEEKQAA